MERNHLDNNIGNYRFTELERMLQKTGWKPFSDAVIQAEIDRRNKEADSVKNKGN